MKLTGETITDEQIRQLSWEVSTGEQRVEAEWLKVHRACNVALHGKSARKRTIARARCAEILNARNGDKS